MSRKPAPAPFSHFHPEFVWLRVLTCVFAFAWGLWPAYVWRGKHPAPVPGEFLGSVAEVIRGMLS